jgi:hypothetical protein
MVVSFIITEPKYLTGRKDLFSLQFQRLGRQDRAVRIMVDRKQSGAVTGRDQGKTQPHRHVSSDLLPLTGPTFHSSYHLPVGYPNFESISGIRPFRSNHLGNTLMDIPGGVLY